MACVGRAADGSWLETGLEQGENVPPSDPLVRGKRSGPMTDASHCLWTVGGLGPRYTVTVLTRPEGMTQ